MNTLSQQQTKGATALGETRSVQGQLLCFLTKRCDQAQCDQILLEWAIVLQRQGQDLVPVPNLTYVSYERLPLKWEEDLPCPVPPELVIKIISLEQTFGEMTQKATDYLRAGVSHVWIVDNQAQSVTAFGANEFPQTFWIDDTISDSLIPGLAILLGNLFAGGRSPDANQNQ